MELRARLASDITPTPPQVVRRGKVLELIGCPWGYQVMLDECRTESDILRWVRHLSTKTWFTGKAASDFISEACKANNINIDG
jgi:hypothetical protein